MIDTRSSKSQALNFSRRCCFYVNRHKSNHVSPGRISVSLSFFLRFKRKISTVNWIYEFKGKPLAHLGKKDLLDRESALDCAINKLNKIYNRNFFRSVSRIHNITYVQLKAIRKPKDDGRLTVNEARTKEISYFLKVWVKKKIIINKIVNWKWEWCSQSISHCIMMVINKREKKRTANMYNAPHWWKNFEQ